jgi:hypothetical protein
MTEWWNCISRLAAALPTAGVADCCAMIAISYSSYRACMTWVALQIQELAKKWAIAVYLCMPAWPFCGS